MPAFDHFSPAALAFLTDLKANNRRDWFQDHKAVYEAEIQRPARAFAAAMCTALDALTGTPHEAKIYRIHRDIRFSRDKTPYNAHLHLSFAPQPATPNRPMWFFGLGTETLSLGCGVFQYDKPGLAAFRTQMAGPMGAELLALIQTLETNGMRVNPPELKRVPSGIDKTHPHADALRRKGLAAWHDLPDPHSVTRPDLIPRTTEALTGFLPLFHLLDRVA
ncbi:DUF2461 domain-containing protein [uncultured Roseobacter sp.]|uniref:DUF2461 domain-containing protein n=1 Tax=uncultured Roseobacter sp. TaxID=114847 RepID=UPI00262D02B4|nr:DUF2461 domain-containing protein [uncultured Roseobacter sp.]